MKQRKTRSWKSSRKRKFDTVHYSDKAASFPSIAMCWHPSRHPSSEGRQVLCRLGPKEGLNLLCCNQLRSFLTLIHKNHVNYQNILFDSTAFLMFRSVKVASAKSVCQSFVTKKRSKYTLTLRGKGRGILSWPGLGPSDNPNIQIGPISVY